MSSVSLCGRPWLRLTAFLFALGLAFAYGLGVGQRSWFPYDFLVRSYQAVSGNDRPQDTVFAEEFKTVSAEQLAGRGYIIHIRHAHRAESIDIQVADYFERGRVASDFSPMTCLSEEGRLQAELTGLVFSELGIVPMRVVTSGSCRANEHAMIAFGRIDAQDVRHLHVSSIPESQRAEHVDGQAEALYDLIRWGDGGVTVIIGHEGSPYSCRPISCLSGLDARQQGGISVISESDTGLVEVARFSRLTDFFNSLAD